MGWTAPPGGLPRAPRAPSLAHGQSWRPPLPGSSKSGLGGIPTFRGHAGEARGTSPGTSAPAGVSLDPGLSFGPASQWRWRPVGVIRPTFHEVVAGGGDRQQGEGMGSSVEMWGEGAGGGTSAEVAL